MENFHSHDGHSHGHSHRHSHGHSHEHCHDEYIVVDELEIKKNLWVLVDRFKSHRGREPNADELHQLQTHGHVHDVMEHAGKFEERDQVLERDFEERAFTVGIGGPVGSGKTALMLALCEALRESHSIAAVTNDIFTKEDGEFLIKHKALDESRICAVETGGCPHAAIREDISANLQACENLSHAHQLDIVLVESGGDNLAANFSRELADFIVYVIDVAGGDKIPRKGGPGITQADLLIVNKIDLAPHVNADLIVMKEDATKMRGSGPNVFAQITAHIGVSDIVKHILTAYSQRVKPK